MWRADVGGMMSEVVMSDDDDLELQSCCHQGILHFKYTYP